MLLLLKIIILFLLVFTIYYQNDFHRNTNNTKTNVFNTDSNRTACDEGSYDFANVNNSKIIYTTDDLRSPCNVTDHTKGSRHRRHVDGKDKSLYQYFERRDRVKKKYAKLFEDLHYKFLENACPDYVKMTDNERMGQCFMETIEDEIHELYDREKTKLEEEFSIDHIPSFLRKLNVTKGMAGGDLPLFHKILKYRYFKKFDQFSLEFFHHLPLIVKNEIRNYFMYTFKGSYDVGTHSRIQYLEDCVDNWMLRCANHTRMGSLGQDAFYEKEFLEEISPDLGEPHMLYEVTEMSLGLQDANLANFSMFMI